MGLHTSGADFEGCGQRWWAQNNEYNNIMKSYIHTYIHTYTVICHTHYEEFQINYVRYGAFVKKK
jgi:hypothetical protein